MKCAHHSNRSLRHRDQKIIVLLFGVCCALRFTAPNEVRTSFESIAAASRPENHRPALWRLLRVRGSPLRLKCAHHSNRSPLHRDQKIIVVLFGVCCAFAVHRSD